MITKYKPSLSYAAKQGRRKRTSPAISGQVKFKPAFFKSSQAGPGSKLKIIVLGGLEEVGRNMTVLEYNNDIIIIDMGLQFPEEDMLGIDYIIPNIAYLEGKKDKIRGVIITHGHYDHIGAIPHLMGKLGNPTIFTGALTAGLIDKRQVEFRQAPKLNLIKIDEISEIKLGHAFTVKFLRINHSIPDCFAVIIETALGTIIHTGDFKIMTNRRT